MSIEYINLMLMLIASMRRTNFQYCIIFLHNHSQGNRNLSGSKVVLYLYVGRNRKKWPLMKTSSYTNTRFRKDNFTGSSKLTSSHDPCIVL